MKSISEISGDLAKSLGKFDFYDFFYNEGLSHFVVKRELGLSVGGALSFHFHGMVDFCEVSICQ